MRSGLFFLAFLVAGSVCEAKLDDDAAALRACRKMAGTNDKRECIEVARGQKFDREAVDACARGVNDDNFGRFTVECFREVRGKEFDPAAVYGCIRVSDGNMLDCLRMIADRKPTASLMNACNRQHGDQKILTCMRQIAWTPINPPGDGTTVTGGDGGANK